MYNADSKQIYWTTSSWNFAKLFLKYDHTRPVFPVSAIKQLHIDSYVRIEARGAAIIVQKHEHRYLSISHELKPKILVQKRDTLN